MNRPQPTTRVRSAGFTLIEALTVVVIMAILAATAIPGIRAMDAQRFDAAAEQVRATLRIARAEADAISLPVGVAINRTDATLTRVLYDPEAEAIETAPGPLGTANTTRYLREIDANLAITTLTNGDGSDEAQTTVWFRHDGRPHVRAGAVGTDFTEDAVIVLASNGETAEIRVRHYTGAIE